MLERFTVPARQTVLRARNLSIELRHPVTGTEHVLLALTEDHGVAGDVLSAAGITADGVKAAIQSEVPATELLSEADAEALRSVGIDLDVVLARIEESFGPEALLPPVKHRRSWLRRRPRPTSRARFGPRARKVLELSVRETLRLKDNQIGTGHILLGLLREGEGLGSKILHDAGVSIPAMQAQVEQALRQAA